ncbi:MAG TPA: glycosyltransferase, partial [Terracidiphilus sp.]
MIFQIIELMQQDACQQATCFRSHALLEIDRAKYVSSDFSVIIPTFRRPRELVEAISSVLRQQESTVEIFVIDDSPEGSAEEGTRGLRDSRIVYVKNPNPTGGVPSVVRNIGWPMAR